MFKNISPESVFSPVSQDLSGKFGCPVLPSQETHTPNPVLSFCAEIRKRFRFFVFNEIKNIIDLFGNGTMLTKL